MEKICQIVDEWPPEAGGIGVYAYNLSEAAEGHVDTVILKPLPKRNQLRLKLRGLVLAGYRHFITHHVFPVGFALYLLSFLRSVKYDVVLHGLDFDMGKRTAWRRVALRLILRRAQFVFTNSHALSDEASAFAGRTTVALHPVVSQKKSEAKRTEWSHPIRLLTVSRLVERKGHLTMLEALATSNLNYVWDIVGDGRMRERIEKRVVELGLEGKVTVHGYVAEEERDELYNQADIFVMVTSKTSKDREGFGIVYIEAQLHGLGIIAADHAEMRESVARENQLISSARELPSAIEAIIQSDRSRLAESNRSFAEQFSVESMATTLNEVYGWN